MIVITSPEKSSDGGKDVTNLAGVGFDLVEQIRFALKRRLVLGVFRVADCLVMD